MTIKPTEFHLYSPLNDFLSPPQTRQLQCWEVPPPRSLFRCLTSTRITSSSPGSHPVLTELHLWRVIVLKGEGY